MFTKRVAKKILICCSEIERVLKYVLGISTGHGD